MKTFKFTDGFTTVQFTATSYSAASRMVPYRFKLLTITK